MQRVRSDHMLPHCPREHLGRPVSPQRDTSRHGVVTAAEDSSRRDLAPVRCLAVRHRLVWGVLTSICLQGVDAAASQLKDAVSHFALRLAFCQTEDNRRWLLTQECDLFRYRFVNQLPSEQVRDKALAPRCPHASVTSLRSMFVTRIARRSRIRSAPAAPAATRRPSFQAAAMYADSFADCLMFLCRGLAISAACKRL